MFRKALREARREALRARRRVYRCEWTSPGPLGFRPWRPLDQRSRGRGRAEFLRLDPHLLRQRRSSPGPRLHDRRRRRAHPLAPSARREGVVPHRHGRARSEDHAHGRGEQRHTPGVVRQARRGGLEAPLGAPRHRERRLHPYHGEAAHRPCAGVRAGPVRQGRDLQGRIRRPVLRGLRGVQAPRRPDRGGGRHEAVPDPQEAGGDPQGGELLLQAQRVRPEAAGVLRGQPRLHPARVGPQRDRELRQAGSPGPVDLALDLRLGRPGPVGRQARHLRMGRRAAQLRDGGRLRRQPGEVRRYVPGERAPDRQGHPAVPLGHLAA